MKQYTVDELRVKAANYCALDEHCCKDVREKLMGWGASAGDADAIVELLVDEQYIDELRYATLFCESKVRHQHWGRKKISFQLKQKSIPADIVSQALSAIDYEQYAEVASALARSKWDTVGGEDFLRRQKVYAFLLSRGFECDIVEQVLKNVAK